MVNYANGKIYKIESSLGDKIYIGSTTKAQLSQRMTAHRGSYKTWKAGKTNMTASFLLFDEYGVENCKIVLLEDCPCESKDQLSAREAHYIRTLACVNKVIPLRTYAEFYQDNRDEMLEKNKAYRDAHRDEIAEKAKAYRETNQAAEYQKEYRESNQAKIAEKKKTYRHAHQAEIAEYKKAYAAANRDAINEQQRARRRAKKDQIKI
jgi:flagellar biosynthesis GTPase FlhF